MQQTARQPDEIRVLFAADTAEAGQDEPIHMYRFQTLTGLRTGELIGLQWNDFDGDCETVQRSRNRSMLLLLPGDSLKRLPSRRHQCVLHSPELAVGISALAARRRTATRSRSAAQWIARCLLHAEASAEHNLNTRTTRVIFQRRWLFLVGLGSPHETDRSMTLMQDSTVS